MSSTNDWEEAAVAGRLAAWMDERARTDRAPERLMRTVMADVARTPRRRPWLPASAWRGAVGYAGLTLAVAVGVTLGILAAHAIETPVGTPPTAAPSVDSSPTPSVPSNAGMPSPHVLARLPDVALSVSAIASDGEGLWVVDRSGELRELDAGSGGTLRSTVLPGAAEALLVTADSVWAASPTGTVVRVDRGTLDVTQIAGAAGGALSAGPDGVWVGTASGVVLIDPRTNRIVSRADVPRRDAELGIAAVPGGAWVATRTEIAFVDAARGEVTTSVPGDAFALLLHDGRLWATRGTELLELDPRSGAILSYAAGFPAGSPIVATGPLLLTAGPPGAAGALLAYDPVQRTIVARGSLPTSVFALAATGDTAWLASDEGSTLLRFETP